MMTTQDVDALKANVARNLATARRARDLTQDQLAAAAGISRATINFLESGEADPLLSTIAQLASALETSPMLLMMGVDEVRAIDKLLRDTEQRSLLEELMRSGGEVEAMRRLMDSQLPKAQRKAATMGVAIATSAGISAGVAGAAIGSAILPGVGTVIGTLLAGFLASRAVQNATASSDKATPAADE